LFIIIINVKKPSVFTALHGMQTRSSDENFVCLSVRLSACLSNAWFVTKRKKVVPAFLYQMNKTFTLVSWQEEWLVGATLSTWNFGSTGPVGAKSPILNRYSLVAPQP